MRIDADGADFVRRGRMARDRAQLIPQASASTCGLRPSALKSGIRTHRNGAFPSEDGVFFS
jgi:hypothetical protein